MSEQREELSTADPAGVPEPGWLLRVSQIEAGPLPPHISYVGRGLLSRREHDLGQGSYFGLRQFLQGTQF